MKSNQIKQAFESVQADSDLADRVLYAAAGEPLRRKGHAKPLYVAVIGCLAGVLATGGVAYAVVNSSYFASAWGNHGNGDSITWTNGGSSGTKYTYTREFGDGIAPQSLEGAVQEVNLSVEGNGYTLDIHEMAIDQNGCGAVTFTLSNPNGVNYYKPAAEIGELVLYGEEEQGIGTPDMKFGEEWPDTRSTIDKDTSSDTVINGTMYFAAMDRERDLQHAVTWNIHWTEGEGESARRFEASTPEFNIGAYVDTKELRSGDSPLEISPFSIQTHIDDLGYEAVDNKLTVSYKDGSEQIIEDDDAGVFNLYFSYGRNSGENIWVPTKLIDVDQVVSVTLEIVRYTSTGETETKEPLPSSIRKIWGRFLLGEAASFALNGNAADFHATDESRSPLERDVSPDKTDQNKPVPIWKGTLPRQARRIPGPGGPLFKFVASSARKGKHLMCFPSCAGL